MKSAPSAASRAASAALSTFQANARHNENPGPPGNKLSTLIDRVDIAPGFRTEGDVVGAHLGKQHGVMAPQAASRTDARTLAETLACLDVGGRVGFDVRAVGAQALGKLNIVLDQTGEATTLHQVDQAPGMTFVDWRFVRANQNASCIGARDCLHELSFDQCRRLRRKLQIEPAPMFDFGHDHGLRRVARVDQTLTASVSNHTARGTVNLHGLEPIREVHSC